MTTGKNGINQLHNKILPKSIEQILKSSTVHEKNMDAQKETCARTQRNLITGTHIYCNLVLRMVVFLRLMTDISNVLNCVDNALGSMPFNICA